MQRIPFPPIRKTLLSMLGPSVVFVALSLNGGEMLLWPNLVANYGMRILWPILIILILQFVVNIEIERYTLVTGKSVEENLVGHSRWLGVVFALTIAAALVWPAWMTTAGNLIAVLIGVPDALVRNVGLIAAIVLLFSSVILFRQRSSYVLLEKGSRYGLIAALGIIAVVVVMRFDGAVFWEGIKGLFAFGYVPADMPRFDFVAALAYGGVAGVLNLVQSEWIRDKGYGVAGLVPSEQAKVEISSVSARKNFKQWFRMINQEHFLLFVLANVFSIFLLAYLGRLLLPAGSAQGFQVLADEIRILNATFPGLGVLFGLAATLIFIMANVTILDAIGRLVYQVLAPLRAEKKPIRGARRIVGWGAGQLSQVAVYVGVGILALSLIFPQFKQPFFLLVTSASLSAFSMWLYPPLLLRLNLALPEAARPGVVRIAFLLMATAFYGVITVWALAAYVSWPIVSILGCVVLGYHGWVLKNLAYLAPAITISLKDSSRT